MQKWRLFQPVEQRGDRLHRPARGSTRTHALAYGGYTEHWLFWQFLSPSSPWSYLLKVWFYLFRNGLELTGRVSLTERRTNRWQRPFYVSSALLGRQAGISQIITPTSKISQLNRNWTILFIQPQGLALKTTQLFEFFSPCLFFPYSLGYLDKINNKTITATWTSNFPGPSPSAHGLGQPGVKFFLPPGAYHFPNLPLSRGEGTFATDLFPVCFERCLKLTLKCPQSIRLRKPQCPFNFLTSHLWGRRKKSFLGTIDSGCLILRSLLRLGGKLVLTSRMDGSVARSPSFGGRIARREC